MIRKMLQAIFCIILCPMLVAQQAGQPSAQALPSDPEPTPAGKADWGRVQDMANGEEIVVERGGRRFPMPCQFAGATRDYLFCDSMYSGREYRYDRTEVQRVRLDDKRRNVHILIGGMAAAGFIWGVATPPADGYPRVLTGLVGAGIGAFAGVVVALPVALLIPGRTVFHQSISKSKTTAPIMRPESAPE
jgi:hypothetical protein